MDAVCSHGHTILHQPQNRFTLQIGNLPKIATVVHQTVICDFKIQDLQLGGQGAPLVPIGGRILFSQYDYCMNLGGFSNISFRENNEQIAFDISPVNTVLNFYANQLGLNYDDRGQLAKKGITNADLLKELNELEFYTPPKSLGFEFVKEIILPIIEAYDTTIKDKLNKFTEHIAKQISIALPAKKGSLFITGGGAYNDYLMERIYYFLPDVDIIIPEKEIVKYKEALIFGLLDALRLIDEINVSKSVTGASKNHSSGTIYEK